MIDAWSDEVFWERGVNVWSRPLKSCACFFRVILRLGDEAEYVMWLRRVRILRDGFFGLALRARKVWHIEERDAQIDSRDQEFRVKLQSARKTFSALLVFVLLKQSDAQVVRAALRVSTRDSIRRTKGGSGLGRDGGNVRLSRSGAFDP